MYNMAAAGLGSSQWWEFSPALDFTTVYDGKRCGTTVSDLVGVLCLTIFLCYVGCAKSAGEQSKLDFDNFGAFSPVSYLL